MGDLQSLASCSFDECSILRFRLLLFIVFNNMFINVRNSYQYYIIGRIRWLLVTIVPVVTQLVTATGLLLLSQEPYARWESERVQHTLEIAPTPPWSG